MDLPAEMDRFVKRTGLFRVTMIERAPPRSLRWLPLLMLVALVVGYMLAAGLVPASTPYGALLRTMAGGLIFFIGYGSSFFLRYIGPRLDPAASEPLDEREKALRARAVAISGTVIPVTCMFAFFYFALAEPFGLWMPHTSLEWGYLGLALQAVWLALPAMVASWLQPKLIEEE